MKYVLIVLSVVIVLMVGTVIAVTMMDYRGEEAGETDETGEGAWQTYTNEQYGFSLMYPPEWLVDEAPDSPISPMFTIYAPGTGEEPPFDHFSEATHVSVYPQGIPTEGVFSRTEPSEASFREPAREARDFLFEDGAPWATMIVPENPPESWNEAGFLWGKAVRSDLRTECFRDGVSLPEEECDPLSGDEVVHRGFVSEEEWVLVREILASFSFIGTPAPAPGGKDNLIRVHSPVPQGVVASPLEIRGEARGTWYFEATFPIVLVDWDGRIIAEHYAEAEGEWMTEEFVPFRAELSFDTPDFLTEGIDAPEFLKRGTLILQKANPSGLPEHDDAVEIPIRFEE